MLTRIVAAFGTLVFLAGMLAINVHFSRQEQALRDQARRAIATAPAPYGLNGSRHLTLDCVVIGSTH